MADSVGKVAKRYAQALFDLVTESNRDSACGALFEVVEAWRSNAELRMAMLNPAFPISERIAALRAMLDKLENGVDTATLDTLKNFLSVVLENGRIGDLESLAASFKEVVEESQNVVAVVVTSARALPDDEKSAIQERVKAACGSKTSISWEQDDSLIAGLQIKIGDSVLDSSVRGALGKARSALS